MLATKDAFAVISVRRLMHLRSLLGLSLILLLAGCATRPVNLMVVGAIVTIGA
jgi:uncharacterized lipoprotein YajG